MKTINIILVFFASAIASIAQNNVGQNIVSSVTLDNWCLQYKYDGRQRMTHKKVPGADWYYMVYDDRDRLVMTQDGEQRKKNEWIVTNYDELNRPVVTGLYSHGKYLSQSGMDSLIHKTSIPATNMEVLTMTFYDDYQFLGQIAGSGTVGLVTGTRTKVLGAPAPYYLLSVNYYDDYNRVVRTVSQNYDGGNDIVSNTYDFGGKITSTKNEHSVNSITWRKMINTQLDGNSVLLSGNNTGGCSSTQFIPASKDGWAETVVAETNTSRYFGLSDNDQDVSPNSIDYSFYLNATQLFIYENGVNKFKVPDGETPGDRLKIMRTGGLVRYYKNDILLYTSTDMSSANLYIDISLISIGARIFNPTISSSMISMTIVKLFEYDHAGRLISTRHSVNEGDTIVLSKNEYNEIGQLVRKKLHSSDAVRFRESIEYRYNIRGWLTSSRAGLFAMDLLYNDYDAGVMNSKMYDGSISAIRWSHPGMGDVRQRAYNFRYDAMHQLIAATSKVNRSAWETSSAFHESDVTYDLNGNIKSLQRSDESGNNIDFLAYDYGSGNRKSNQLRGVSDSGISKGFVDGNTAGDDYNYDTNGNLITDMNKGIMSIAYNVLNLPVVVTKNNGESICYLYDASGRKLSKIVRDKNGLQQKLTDYHGEFIYQNDTLRVINHEEGRLVPNKQSNGFSYEYDLKDHLGNVRTTFTTKDERKAAIEDFESPTSEFINYSQSVKINSTIFDHTDSGPTYYSARLNGTSKERYGVAKSLSVMPGDTIKMDVFAKYLDPDSAMTPSLSAFLSAIANGTAPAGTIKDGSLPGGAGSLAVPITVFSRSVDNENDNAPKAYLNWVIFDRNYMVKNGGAVQISTKAAEHGENGAHEHLSKQIVIGEAGYIYIYLSNDNYAMGKGVVDVYFDDFKVEHTLSPIVQTQDYYPFGLTFDEYSRENSTPNWYEYNGKEKQPDLGLGWFDYGSRMYLPDIGRWSAIDPKAQKYSGYSPYNYVLNNPVNAIDPDGQDAILIAFPDYKIQTPAGRVAGLGHAGVLLIDNKTGVTRYYEYGRYDSDQGEVKRRVISNVIIDKRTGQPTVASLNKVLRQLSRAAGHGGKIRGAYVKSDKFNEMKVYADGKLAENDDPGRRSYSLTSNNCGTFARDVVMQDEEVDNPKIFNPTPINIVDEYIEEGNAEVNYDPKKDKTTIGEGNEKDAKKKRSENRIPWSTFGFMLSTWMSANPNIQVNVK